MHGRGRVKEMPMKRALLAILAAAALGGGLAACATATPYQPLNAGNATAGGYSDSKLDNTHWRVIFAGNTVTSRETVERYLLFRAAELTVSQGYDWFASLDQQTDKQTTAYVDSFYGGYGWHPYWRYYGYGGWGAWGAYGPTSVTTFNRYEVTAQIVMGRGPMPPDGRALDAHQVMTNLGPGIERPKA
jgi:hypothetical protein